MLKRLIEVALPLKEVSEQSAREKSIRHGHISTLHIWWARRPLAACRAVVFASLIPDPDDPECPESFRQLVRTVLSDGRYKPTGENGGVAEDTPRGRVLEFIKHLVKWENSNEPEIIEPARKLIAAAHRFLNPASKDTAPKVLDPFAGGGAIPLEALRLGCEAHAIDINPVAHLIELCTLVYPQKFGRPLPKDAPLPPYIERLIAHNNARGRTGADEHPLFEAKAAPGKKAEPPKPADDDPVPDVEITAAEYRRNPLAADVKYWGHWVLARARKELAQFYPPDPDGAVPVAYLWARTVKCSNPACGATIPLVRQSWLCNRPGRKVALRLLPNAETKRCDFAIAEGREINFDPDLGTMQRGQGECLLCHTIANSKYLQSEGHGGRIGQQLMAVVTVRKGVSGKQYRCGSSAEVDSIARAAEALATAERQCASDFVPQEPLKAWSGVFNAPLFGMTRWGALFSARQALVLGTLVCLTREAVHNVPQARDPDYAKAVGSYLALAFDWFLDKSSTLARWHNTRELISGTFGRQALPMVWDYAEVSPVVDASGGFLSGLDWNLLVIKAVSSINCPGRASRASATALPANESAVDAVITDPPYYDAVPYSDLSDFFYVWLKRTVGGLYPDAFRTPLTPKAQELVSHLGHNYPGQRKTASDYEKGMGQAFSEMKRVLSPVGVAAVMFAHKTTSAWEAIIAGLLDAGLLVTSSWPFHTEMKARLRAQESAALASSVTLVCRKRAASAGDGLWDDVRQELKGVAAERLDFFWNQGIRGADFFISAIGPALSVFGRCERVVRTSGEPVTVGQFLDEVRSLVTAYALAKIMKTGKTGAIDAETLFYVVWRWSYGGGKVPADEAFKLAQALRLETDSMWDRTGVLEKAGENVLAMPIENRTRIKDLGEPQADGRPASVIDALHRLCAFRDKGDTAGMAEFLARSGHARNETLWVVAQAISEILPDGDKEKQLMQGLLNQREGVIRAAAEAKGLF
jgi:adenine-specific DNA methylase